MFLHHVAPFPGKKEEPPASAVNWGGHSRQAFLAALLMLLVGIAYVPALQGGFTWDDDAHVYDNVLLRSTDGFWQFWSNPRCLPTRQAYPLTFSGCCPGLVVLSEQAAVACTTDLHLSALGDRCPRAGAVGLCGCCRGRFGPPLPAPQASGPRPHCRGRLLYCCHLPGPWLF